MFSLIWKQSWGWWFETLLRPFWRHCNGSEKSWAKALHKCRGRLSKTIWPISLTLNWLVPSQNNSYLKCSTSCNGIPFKILIWCIPGGFVNNPSICFGAQLANEKSSFNALSEVLGQSELRAIISSLVKFAVVLARHKHRSRDWHSSTGVLIVYSTVCSGADQRKHQSSALMGLCAGNSPVTGEFPAQRPINAENVFMCWRRHASCFLHRHRENPKARNWKKLGMYCISWTSVLQFFFRVFTEHVSFYWRDFINLANTQCNIQAIITSKLRFDLIITCLLRFLFAGNFLNDMW